MPRLVVVGGGISGLAAAWAARRLADQRGVPLDVLVLERNAEVGGKARSIEQDGWLVEAGPPGFPGGRPEMERLVAEAGLSADAIPAGVASRRRFIYRAGRMCEIVPIPVALVRHGLLSLRGLGRMLVEPFVPARRDRRGDSVWDFAARRLGREVADRMVPPMALRIFAGDARRLSLGAAFPRMAALEHEHGFHHPGDDREARAHPVRGADVVPPRDAEPPARPRPIRGVHRQAPRACPGTPARRRIGCDAIQHRRPQQRRPWRPHRGRSWSPAAPSQSPPKV